MSVRIFAPAKINLTLKVGRPRADGLHPLQSVVVFADVGDWVDAEPADKLSLEIRGPWAPSLSADPSNLVLCAARALALAAGISPCAKLVLEKNLPIASGMGGGSSDAAATMRALNVLWALGFSEAQLTRIAGEIGADVPVCVAGRSVYMTGVGEICTPITTPVMRAVLVNPGRPLATAAVYRQFDLMSLGGGFAERPPPMWRDGASARADITAMGNDLEAPAQVLMPEISLILRTLAADSRVLCTGMSGSGASIFALFVDAVAAHALADELALMNPRWWVRPAVLGA